MRAPVQNPLSFDMESRDLDGPLFASNDLTARNNGKRRFPDLVSVLAVLLVVVNAVLVAVGAGVLANQRDEFKSLRAEVRDAASGGAINPPSAGGTPSPSGPSPSPGGGGGGDSPSGADGEKSRYVLLETDSGKVQGIRTAAAEAYLGLRYAKKPRRLKVPVPDTETWSPRIRDATSFAAACPQLASREQHFQHPNGFFDTDCLYLNAYISRAGGASAPKKPIVVWIHGGNHTIGSAGAAPFDYEAFAVGADVTLFTPNYRLGPLGFLAGEQLADPDETNTKGNWGLLDLAEALRWIVRHGERFGGDTSKITIMGHEAGAELACMLALSPLTRNYVSRVALLGGSCPMLDDDATSDGVRARDNINMLAMDMLCAVGGNPMDVGDCIRNTCRPELQANCEVHEDESEHWFLDKSVDVHTGPVYDTTSFPLESVPWDEVAKEWIIGIAEHEGASRLGQYEAVLRDFMDGIDIGPSDLQTMPQVQAKEETRRLLETTDIGRLALERAQLDTLWQAYTPDGGPYLDGAMRLFGDVTATCPSLALADRLAAKPGTKVYHMVYNAHPHWKPPGARDGSSSDDLWGAYGGSELFAMFAAKPYGWEWTADDSAHNAMVQKLFGSFAASGDPNVPGLPRWPSYSPSGTRHSYFVNSGAGSNEVASDYRQAQCSAARPSFDPVAGRASSSYPGSYL